MNRKATNKGKYINRQFFFISSMTLFFVVLLGNILIIRMEYRNYQDKIHILCRMVSTEDKIENAAGILKGYTVINEDKTNTKEDIVDKNEVTGEKTLESYGYNLKKGNALYHEFWQQSLQIIIISVFLYILCVAAIWWLYSYEKTKRTKEIHKLEDLLSGYRKQEFNSSDPSPFLLQNNEIETLYSDILSFGDYLKLLNEKVTQEKEATKALVTDISHQLKTPVAALKTSFEILQREDLSQKDKKEFTDRCSLQLKGIKNLLEALINISRLETGMITIKQENIILFETILDALNRVYQKAKEKEIQIEMETEEELQKLTLPHDKKWLSEALINILDNAVKYSPENSGILIRMMKRTTFLRIEIEDQGIGIPKMEFNEIFKRFYRGNSKEVKELPGSGVGLYLTREIITRHKGTIRVSSGEKGTGSKFIIQLPYCL